MSGDRPLAERSRIYVRPFNGLRAAISSALSIYTLLFPAAVHAAANELDNDYFALVVEEILDRGFPCSSGDIGHILYEDDLVAVIEVVCESGQIYEIIDIYNLESVIIEPIERMTDEEMDNYFNRISYSIT